MDEVKSRSVKQANRVRLFWILLAVSFVIGILVLLGMALFSESASGVSIGQSAPSFTLEAYSGETIETESARGKIVVINFWSSWCTTCDEEAQMLQTVWSDFQESGRQDVVFLGVAYMDTEPNSLAFLETYKVTYPNGPDLRGEISKRYQVSSVPETFVLDADGILRVIKIGPFTAIEEIYQAIQSAASGN
jgi:cytochrome c biogenesis protein CcmG, thiol:disulfide interchange protein DsbE